MANHIWNPRLLRHYGRQRQFLKRIAEADPETLDPQKLVASTRDLLEGSLEVLGGERIVAATDPFRDCCLVWDVNQPADYGSGVYLGGRTVISAAHVLDPTRSYRVSLPLTDEQTRTQTMIDVTQILFRKDDPRPSGGKSDLALLSLASLPTGIPSPLVAQPADFQATITSTEGVTICGFGQAWDPPGLSERRGIKRSASDVEVHPSPPAPSPDSDFAAAFEFLAGGRSNGTVADTCFGDSGGPVYVVNANGSHTLLGITSRGIGNVCGNGGIYTRIDAHRDWILANLT
jgi:secreted trypsin-like serine protease